MGVTGWTCPHTDKDTGLEPERADRAMFTQKLFTVFVSASLPLVFGKEPLDSEGKYISLADHLVPKGKEGEREPIKQSRLLARWARDYEEADNTTFRLGSQELVQPTDDKGFFSVIQAAYNNHWVLETRPEDWWTTISSIIATRIDKEANNKKVRSFFVSHEGKKVLKVKIDSIDSIENESFFSQMRTNINKNINKPGYTTMMESDFTSSTSTDRIINSIMLMKAFEEYYHYVAELECGIPGVRMLGRQKDWEKLVKKLQKVKKFLEPIDDVLKLGGWFDRVRGVLDNLLETYRGNPDKDWWSRIMDIQKSFGSGGGTFLTGWFVTDFLGITNGDLESLPSGINLVSLTITDGNIEEESILLAGFTGYTIGSDSRNQTSVKAKSGWSLQMNKYSAFQ